MIIKDEHIVLFQGDSITDAGRSRQNDAEMGWGYASFIAAQFNSLYPYMNVKFINRGVGGDRVVDLIGRWQEDCINLAPNIVSILIGINECSTRYTANRPTTVEEYEEGYRSIVDRAIKETGAKVIILEPFVFPFPEERKTWRVDLDPKIHAARRIAADFNAIYIPLDGIFASYVARKPSSFWSADGVHPTPPGHMVIADAWLKAVGVKNDFRN